LKLCFGVLAQEERQKKKVIGGTRPSGKFLLAQTQANCETKTTKERKERKDKKSNPPQNRGLHNGGVFRTGLTLHGQKIRRKENTRKAKTVTTSTCG